MALLLAELTAMSALGFGLECEDEGWICRRNLDAVPEDLEVFDWF